MQILIEQIDQMQKNIQLQFQLKVFSLVQLLFKNKLFLIFNLNNKSNLFQTQEQNLKQIFLVLNKQEEILQI